VMEDVEPQYEWTDKQYQQSESPTPYS